MTIDRTTTYRGSSSRPRREHPRHERRGRRPRIAGALAAAVATLAFAGTADATAPARTTESFHRTVNPFATCPGFTVVGEFDLVRELTTYYDRDGVAIRRLVRADITGTLNHAGTGASLPSSGVRVFQFDLVTGEAFSTGSNTVVRLPDGGAATIGTGQLEFDSQGRLLDHHGPDFDTEFDQLCAALAPSP